MRSNSSTEPPRTIQAYLAAYRLGGPEALKAAGVYVPDTMTLDHLIQGAVGQASMCWAHPEGAGTFQSERAIKVSQELREAVVKEIIVAWMLRNLDS